MQFISVDKFLKADGKVVGEIIKWWEPMLGDLTECTKDNEVWCLSNENKLKEALDAVKQEKLIVPLLTVSQLIDFIECKLNQEISILKDDGYKVFTDWVQGQKNSGYVFESESHNLLLALWEIAQEVALQ